MTSLENSASTTSESEGGKSLHRLLFSEFLSGYDIYEGCEVYGVVPRPQTKLSPAATNPISLNKDTAAEERATVVHTAPNRASPFPSTPPRQPATPARPEVKPLTTTAASAESTPSHPPDSFSSKAATEENDSDRISYERYTPMSRHTSNPPTVSVLCKLPNPPQPRRSPHGPASLPRSSPQLRTQPTRPEAQQRAWEKTPSTSSSTPLKKKTALSPATTPSPTVQGSLRSAPPPGVTPSPLQKLQWQQHQRSSTSTSLNGTSSSGVKTSSSEVAKGRDLTAVVTKTVVIRRSPALDVTYEASEENAGHATAAAGEKERMGREGDVLPPRPGSALTLDEGEVVVGLPGSVAALTRTSPMANTAGKGGRGGGSGQPRDGTVRGDEVCAATPTAGQSRSTTTADDEGSPPVVVATATSRQSPGASTTFGASYYDRLNSISGSKPSVNAAGSPTRVQAAVPIPSAPTTAALTAVTKVNPNGLNGSGSDDLEDDLTAQLSTRDGDEVEEVVDEEEEEEEYGDVDGDGERGVGSVTGTQTSCVTPTTCSLPIGTDEDSRPSTAHSERPMPPWLFALTEQMAQRGGGGATPTTNPNGRLRVELPDGGHWNRKGASKSSPAAAAGGQKSFPRLHHQCGLFTASSDTTGSGTATNETFTEGEDDDDDLRYKKEFGAADDDDADDVYAKSAEDDTDSDWLNPTTRPKRTLSAVASSLPLDTPAGIPSSVAWGLAAKTKSTPSSSFRSGGGGGSSSAPPGGRGWAVHGRNGGTARSTPDPGLVSIRHSQHTLPAASQRDDEGSALSVASSTNVCSGLPPVSNGAPFAPQGRWFSKGGQSAMAVPDRMSISAARSDRSLTSAELRDLPEMHSLIQLDPTSRGGSGQVQVEEEEDNHPRPLYGGAVTGELNNPRSRRYSTHTSSANGVVPGAPVMTRSGSGTRRHHNGGGGGGAAFMSTTHNGAAGGSSRPRPSNTSEEDWQGDDNSETSCTHHRQRRLSNSSKKKKKKHAGRRHSSHEGSGQNWREQDDYTVSNAGHQAVSTGGTSSAHVPVAAHVPHRPTPPPPLPSSQKGGDRRRGCHPPTQNRFPRRARPGDEEGETDNVNEDSVMEQPLTSTSRISAVSLPAETTFVTANQSSGTE